MEAHPKAEGIPPRLQLIPNRDCRAGGGVKGPFEWEEEFKEKLCSQPLGGAAWKTLETAGMGDFAKYLLYEFYCYGASEPPKIGRGLAKINSNLERLKYSDTVAREKQGEPSGKKFADKRKRALENSEKSVWPFRNEQVKTFGDAKANYMPLRMLPLDYARAAIGDGRQALERYEGKTLLVVLRAGAKARKINLSMTQLSELAYAAGENLDPMERQSLQRFFSYPDIKRVERAFQLQFESTEHWDLFLIAEAVRQEIVAQPSNPLQSQ
jgi:hypothetical protein